MITNFTKDYHPDYCLFPISLPFPSLLFPFSSAYPFSCPQKGASNFIRVLPGAPRDTFDKLCPDQPILPSLPLPFHYFMAVLLSYAPALTLTDLPKNFGSEASSAPS